jgi:uncharacterized LabA/DUF88 family protein
MYVDGFNFYYGTTNHYRKGRDQRGYSLSGLCWCDFRALAERHLLDRKRDSLDCVKYFTAPVPETLEMSKYSGEHERYQMWMCAARTIRGLQVVEGFYERIPGEKKRSEKQTDVNLALEIVMDAMEDLDHAIVLSGDADEIPAIVAAQARMEREVQVTVLLTPNEDALCWLERWKRCMRRVCDRERRGELQRQVRGVKAPRVVTLGEKMLAESLLPWELTGADGRALSCPDYWRVPADYLADMCQDDWRPDRVLVKKA